MQSGEQQPGTVGGLPVAFEEVLAVVPKQGGGTAELQPGTERRQLVAMAN